MLRLVHSDGAAYFIRSRREDGRLVTGMCGAAARVKRSLDQYGPHHTPHAAKVYAALRRSRRCHLRAQSLFVLHLNVPLCAARRVAIALRGGARSTRTAPYRSSGRRAFVCEVGRHRWPCLHPIGEAAADVRQLRREQRRQNRHAHRIARRGLAQADATAPRGCATRPRRAAAPHQQ